MMSNLEALTELMLKQKELAESRDTRRGLSEALESSEIDFRQLTFSQAREVLSDAFLSPESSSEDTALDPLQSLRRFITETERAGYPFNHLFRRDLDAVLLDLNVKGPPPEYHVSEGPRSAKQEFAERFVMALDREFFEYYGGFASDHIADLLQQTLYPVLLKETVSQKDYGLSSFFIAELERGTPINHLNLADDEVYRLFFDYFNLREEYTPNNWDAPHYKPSSEEIWSELMNENL